MIPYAPNTLTRVPETLEKRREIVQALGTLAAQDDARVRQRQGDVGTLCRDVALLRHSLPRYYLENPDGKTYTAHPEDNGHWRHWDVQDGDGDDQGRWPPNSKKPR